MNITKLMRKMREDRRMLYLVLFTQTTIEKDIFDIHLTKCTIPIGNRSKDLLIINLIFSFESFGHKIFLVSLNKSIPVRFGLTIPFYTQQ